MSGASRDPLAVLGEVFGYDSFRPLQEKVIDRVLKGGHALVVMPTGSGKSLCYQIPAIAREGVGIVVSPLIALMQDQVAALREAGVRAAFVNSSLPAAEVRRVESELVEGRYDLVYVAPERLVTPAFLELLGRARLGLFAIDEAHCLSQWGHDFRPEYRKLDVLASRFSDVPRIALTATADAPTRRDIAEHLSIDEAGVFVAGFDRPNIRYHVQAKQSARQQLLGFVRSRHRGESGIVYCMSRKRVEETATFLDRQGVPALPYHAGLDAGTRQRHQERFLRSDGLVMVATIAFGLGIDKPDVRFVVHLDLPKSLEAYYQETGRAGRDGLPADAWMCYGYNDVVLIRQMVERSEAASERKRIEHLKLNALLGYCETAECRRAVLLRYFGEEHGGGCDNCDTCLEPAETYDGTTVAQKALSNVYRTGQRFGAAYLADVLLGADNDRIARNRHDRVSTFGIGADLDRKSWLGIYRQLVAAGLLDVDTEHGGLSLSDRARPVLKGEQNVQLRKERKTAAPRADAARGTFREALSESLELELFESLRKKRLELAETRNVPAYVIFHDRTLEEMARRRPTSREALSEIVGVGERKLESFGEDFLAVIRAHAGTFSP